MDVRNVRLSSVETIRKGSSRCGFRPRIYVRSGIGDEGRTKSGLALRNPEPKGSVHLNNEETRFLRPSNRPHQSIDVAYCGFRLLL
jgi:hypothetical protein